VSTEKTIVNTEFTFNFDAVIQNNYIHSKIKITSTVVRKSIKLHITNVKTEIANKNEF